MNEDKIKELQETVKTYIETTDNLFSTIENYKKLVELKEIEILKVEKELELANLLIKHYGINN